MEFWKRALRDTEHTKKIKVQHVPKVNLKGIEANLKAMEANLKTIEAK